MHNGIHTLTNTDDDVVSFVCSDRSSEVFLTLASAISREPRPRPSAASHGHAMATRSHLLSFRPRHRSQERATLGMQVMVKPSRTGPVHPTRT